MSQEPEIELDAPEASNAEGRSDGDRTSTSDSACMRRALELAEMGRGSTSPNPVVGAVVVRDGRIVGEGYHERCGGPHAEINALSQAGPLADGATLYVTLEPCSVTGRTPPCTEAILKSGLARTVVPVEDPNPDVAGRGLAVLRGAGMRVDVGLMREEAVKLNAPYFKFRSTGLPFTTLKLALSLDGRIAAPPGGPRWVSSPESRERVHAMRAAADCVVVGVGTVLVDDPRLTDRRSEATSRQPVRLVVDSSLRTPGDAAVVATARSVRTIVACAEDAAPARAELLKRSGVVVWRLPRADGGIDLEAVARRAASEGLLSVLAEGGASLAGSLLNAELVDRVAFFIAPSLYGADATPALPRLSSDWWGGRNRFESVSWSAIGGDCLFEADVVQGDGSD